MRPLSQRSLSLELALRSIRAARVGNSAQAERWRSLSERQALLEEIGVVAATVPEAAVPATVSAKLTTMESLIEETEAWWLQRERSA